MGYTDPYETDEQTANRDSRLWKKQARKDSLTAKAEGGMDAAIADSKRDNTARLDGFKKIPGASRSGALDPQTRAKVLHRESIGEIELQRDEHGALVGFRSLAYSRTAP